MSELDKLRHSAIASVGKHFSATWESGGDTPPDAYLKVGRKRIALDVAILARKAPGRKSAEKVRLREDVVGQRALRDLERNLHEHVPESKTIILNLGAPIKVANKLVAAL